MLPTGYLAKRGQTVANGAYGTYGNVDPLYVVTDNCLDYHGLALNNVSILLTDFTYVSCLGALGDMTAPFPFEAGLGQAMV